MTFKEQIQQGIPNILPGLKPYEANINHAPKRKDILSSEEKKLAIRNALRYFQPKDHAVLAPEFYQELLTYGRIYMYRFRPAYQMYARSFNEYPAKSKHAACIMLMIQNNLDPAVAQHPHELITYGGNGTYKYGPIAEALQRTHSPVPGAIGWESIVKHYVRPAFFH